MPEWQIILFQYFEFQEKETTEVCVIIQIGLKLSAVDIVLPDYQQKYENDGNLNKCV